MSAPATPLMLSLSKHLLPSSRRARGTSGNSRFDRLSVNGLCAIILVATVLCGAVGAAPSPLALDFTVNRDDTFMLDGHPIARDALARRLHEVHARSPRALVGITGGPGVSMQQIAGASALVQQAGLKGVAAYISEEPR